MLPLHLVAAPAFATGTAARARCRSARGSSVAAVTAEDTFRRARLLTLDGPVTARDVVNVLGRWKTHEQWDTIGELREIDKLFDKDWQPLKPLPSLSPSFFSTRRASDTKEGAAYAARVDSAVAAGRVQKVVYKSRSTICRASRSGFIR